MFVTMYAGHTVSDREHLYGLRTVHGEARREVWYDISARWSAG